MVNRKVALLRADASLSIGVGHVMRSISLGEALVAEGFRVEFVSFNLAQGLNDIATGSGLTVVELDCEPFGRQDAEFVLERAADVSVIDGYEFSREFYAVLESGVCKFAVIDDNVETKALSPTLVINQNPHAVASMYGHLIGNPTLLLGLQYALIRREVREYAKTNQRVSDGSVFVAMGGSDFLGLTAPLVRELAQLGRVVRVAVGHTNPRRAEVAATAAEFGNVELIDQSQYVASLAKADIAVLAAGSSLWEAAALGVPTLALIVADNQVASSAAAATLDHILTVDCRGSKSSEPLIGSVLQLATDLLLPIRVAKNERLDCDGAQRTAHALMEIL